MDIGIVTASLIVMRPCFKAILQAFKCIQRNDGIFSFASLESSSRPILLGAGSYDGEQKQNRPHLRVRGRIDPQGFHNPRFLNYIFQQGICVGPKRPCDDEIVLGRLAVSLYQLGRAFCGD